MAEKPVTNASQKEPPPVYILITQCLQNGFFLDEGSRLALPVNEVIRMLVGSPLELEAELRDPKDTSHLIHAWGILAHKDEREAFRSFLSKKYPPPQPNPGSETVTSTESTVEAEPSVDTPPGTSLRQKVIQLTGLQYLTDFMEFHRLYSYQNRRIIPKKLLEQGPLYQFLKAVIDDTPRDEKARLHVIHVRDWHHTSDSFDEERRRYGLHCMAETWAAEPIEGYEQYLQPWHGNADAQAAALTSTGYTPEGSHVTFYDVRSNSLFDFKPDEGNKGVGLREILDRIIGTNPRQRVYVIVIGVYTDIKVKILLTSLRERYDIKNLIVSDVLTGAPSLERHLAGLDFVQKVLSVEVTHSLDELAQVLSQSERKHHISDTIIRNSTSFRQYQTYFLDKQNLLAYQEQKQLEYLELTKRRATRVYKIILLANYALLVFGITFVLLAIIAALLGIFSPSRVSSDYLTGTGILGVAGLAQLVMIFFTNPINTLQKNLTHLVKLQLGVESRGLRMALMRYHFARPERLYPQDPVLEEQELANVRHQLELIQSFSKDTLDELQDKTGEETAETPL